MKMYKAWMYDRIDEYEVTKITDKSVWFLYPGNTKPSMERRYTNDASWEKTREEAKAFLVNRSQQRVRKAEDSLKYWQARLAEAEKL